VADARFALDVDERPFGSEFVMKGFATALGSTVLAAAAVVAGAFAADTDETPTIKEVMTKLNKGPKSISAKLKTALAATSPDWDSIQSLSTEFRTFAESMPKNDPPKGHKDSWKKLVTAYVADAKSLESAAKKKDHDAAEASRKKLSASCKACHSVHK
jgi:hypothetical protein